MKTIGIVVPVYNEGPNIELLVEAIHSNLPHTVIGKVVFLQRPEG